MKYYLHTLSNGLTVIFVDTLAFPTVTTLLLVGAGSRYETAATNGIAHFFEHIPSKGTKKYPTAYDLSSTIEGLGGMFNAFTSKDHTGYWIKATREHFETTLDITAEMLLNPLLDPAEIEREKGVIVEEINMYEDMPARRLGEILDNIMYKGNPLGYDILGTKKTVTSFTKKTFTDYMNTFYYPNNAVLIVAGGIQYEKYQNDKLQYYTDLIEARFGKWKPGKKPSFTPVVEKQTAPDLIIQHKKTEQAHFSMGFRTFSFLDGRKHALTLLATILGGGSSSRLFTEVREKRGLCYYIGTGRELYHDVGNLIIQAGVTKDLDKVKEAIRVSLAECKKLADGKLEVEELVRAKEHIKGKLFISLEDSFDTALFFGMKQLMENTVHTPQEAIAKISAVSVDEVVGLARTIFKPENLSFAMIGPFQENDIKASDLAGL